MSWHFYFIYSDKLLLSKSLDTLISGDMYRTSWRPSTRSGCEHDSLIDVASKSNLHVWNDMLRICSKIHFTGSQCHIYCKSNPVQYIFCLQWHHGWFCVGVLACLLSQGFRIWYTCTPPFLDFQCASFHSDVGQTAHKSLLSQVSMSVFANRRYH